MGSSTLFELSNLQFLAHLLLPTENGEGMHVQQKLRLGMKAFPRSRQTQKSEPRARDLRSRVRARLSTVWLAVRGSARSEI